MKKSILILVVFVITIFSSTGVFAQKFRKLDVSPMDAASYPASHKKSNKLVKVIYSRPQLKGRALDKLIPDGKVWRTGANEAVEITFYKDAVFGGEKVKKGTYTLFTIPSEKEWTVILSNHKNVWGAYSYKEEKDVVRVKAKVSKSDKIVEAFSIVFEGKEENATMYLGWGDLVVSLPIKG